MPSPLRLLGIETSCDETAVAVVDGNRRILAQRILSQLDDHRPFGGVVPEVAARAHLQHLDRLIAETMTEAGLGYADLDGVAATAGPGLIGGVIVGVTMAKAVAMVHRLPFIAVNHLEGHALSARLDAGSGFETLTGSTGEVEFPYLLLLVSGGHCQLLIVDGVGDYRRLGTTLDDALGEAFDKIAKLVGLGYPGGPAVEAAARSGNAARFALPRPMMGRDGCHFSFSGLKTAVKHAWSGLGNNNQDIQARADICAAFQQAAADVLVDRTANALNLFTVPPGRQKTLVVAGGVAANAHLRARLASLAAGADVRMAAPPQWLCTDNGAMIAWAGIERLRLGLSDGLDFAPRPRWPLDPRAPAAAFAGVKA